MSKFSLKADHFTTPLKLVLPGIIVSLIGASAGYFLFNNPEEKKAKESYRTWAVMKEYEEAFIKGKEAFYCAADSLDQLKFHKDYAHLLDILINNFQDLKGNKEMDPRLSAFLNIKIARYKESLKLTDTFLIQLAPMNEYLKKNTTDVEMTKKAKGIVNQFMQELNHIETRDNDELIRIGQTLDSVHKKYKVDFPVYIEKIQPLNEIRGNVPGKWSFPEVQYVIELRQDSSGLWQEPGLDLNFKWSMKDSLLVINLESQQVFNFVVVKATATSFVAGWIEAGSVMVGCRRDNSIEAGKKNKPATTK